MTEKETQLLEIAREIIELNKGINAKLTGSLMLAVMGMNKRREAADIDIICDYLCKKEDGFPIVPKEFKECGIDGSRSEVNAIQFKNSDGLKVEFMYSEETAKEINGVACGELNWLIEAKQEYAKNDKDEQSKAKHTLDLAYLFKNNTNLI